jgi:hypothetical protein
MDLRIFTYLIVFDSGDNLLHLFLLRFLLFESYKDSRTLGSGLGAAGI